MSVTDKSVFRLAGALALGCSSLLWAPDSHAFQTLYDELSASYGYAGDCSICHASPLGGGGAAKPFAVTLKGKGLTATVDTLKTALAALTAADDSDGDGASDLDELTLGGDPNDPAVGVGQAEDDPVEYGCVGGTIAGSTQSSPNAALLAAGLVAGALLWSRRRS